MKTKKINSLLIVFTLVCFAFFSAEAGQTPSPPPANQNTWYGYQALFNDTTGDDNTALGFKALFSNTTANQNTAVGSQALFSNTTGNFNAAYGFGALSSNTTGFLNAAMGRTALFSNTTGRRNSAIGNGSLFVNTTGNLNTADGHTALVNNTTGNGNIALGESAGRNIINGSSNIDIGYPSACDGCTAPTGPDESNTIRIGDSATQTDTYVAGIFGSSTITPGMPVYVDANGKLGTLPSSARFKENVKSMDNASDEIFSLKPVTFNYKTEFTKEKAPQFGLVAEEVAKVDPNLVVRDAKEQIESVRYEAVNAMMLNELIKAHQQVQNQQKQIDKLTAQLKEQASALQKVSAQVELMKTAPRTVADSH